jgi:putative hemolysin
MEPPASSFYYDILLFLISLLGCALFSFLETSIAALRLFKLKEMSQATRRYRLLFQTLEANPNRILISILIAYNLASVTAAALGSGLTERLSRYLNLSESLGFAIGIFLTTMTILIADLIPKSIATRNGDKLFSSTLWMTNITYYLFYPFVTFLSRFTDSATQIISGAQDLENREWATSEKEIQFLIDYINEKGLMERHKTAMLKSIFELGTTAIREIMVPETSMIAIDINSTQRETIDLFSKYQYTRMPVYEGNPDNIIGMVLQKDFFILFAKNEDRALREIVRPIIFMPESTKVLRALKEFREQRMHIAMVINEFGGITGLVTLEDVIEEIVGEISDEYEAVTEKMVPLKNGGWLIDATIELEELSELLGIEFESEDAISLGGFLIEQFQHIPQKGEKLVYKNYVFQIQQAGIKRIFQVLVCTENTPECTEITNQE